MQLVINTFGARLRKDGERFLVQAGDKKLAVSAHKVQSILRATGAVLSTDEDGEHGREPAAPPRSDRGAEGAGVRARVRAGQAQALAGGGHEL